MTTDIATAEQVVQDLINKRQHLAERALRMADERREISYSAHAEGDHKARSKLDKLNAESATHASELASLEDAISAAQAKLEQAQQTAAQEQDRTDARALRAVLERFVAHADSLDAAFATICSEANALEDILNEIHALGSEYPTHTQLDSLGARAIKTALMTTPWRKEFEHLAPGERRSFSELVCQWANRIETDVARRLGELEAA